MSEKATINISIFKRLVSHLKPYRKTFFVAVLCSILLAVLGVSRPLLIRSMVNNYIAIDLKTETPQPNMLLFWTLVILGILFVEQIIQFVGSYFSNLIAQSIINDIRKKLFGHLLSFRMRYFDKTPVGSLVTRVVSDLEAITEVFSAGLMDNLGDVFLLLLIVVTMLVLNWQLALMTILPIPILLYATRIFARAMRASFQQERIQVNKLNTFVQERITGMAIVQLFNREKKEYENFEQINKDHRQAHINAVWANSIFFPVVELLSSLSMALLLVWGALQISGKSSEEIQLMNGETFAFVLFIQMLYRPIRQLADKFNILQRGTVRAERVFEIIDLNEHIQDAGTKTNCNFDQTIAFVGATGAGKSTIVNLLGRFYEFQKGEIFIGNTEVRQIELNSLRRNIAIVLQDVFLFSDTIHNNITLGDESISREQVIAAAKIVGADEFIQKLPGGYDYEVRERGGVLSVGQPQLLSFIRACVYNPEILILDEATSSVDNESEEMIQKATEELTKGRTSIVIAHRLSTIQKADKIVVLDKGEIKEIGSHSELLSQDGYYRKLFDMQFKEEKE